MKFEYILLIGIVVLAVFLRLYKIDINPPGLYIDEASIGQNAYTILTTGKDEYGISSPLWFRSFGDYKMPVYIYSVAGAMALFGKNEFAVRFPSAVAGVVSVFAVFFFVKNLLGLDKSFPATYKKYVPSLTAFLLAISTWHIHFSRGGFEVNLGVCFYLLGALLFTIFLKKKNNLYLFVGIGIFLLSMYTYHSFRVASPITVAIGLIYFYQKFAAHRKSILLGALIFVAICVPIFQFSLTKEGSERFAQTSAFSEYKVSTPMEQVIMYPLVYVKNYLSFFSLNFLFSNGDGNGRHQMAAFGLFYLWEFIFLLFGIYAVIKRKKSYIFYIVFGMILLAVAPAALSRPSPHSLRSLLMVVPLTILIAIGLIEGIGALKRHARPLVILVVIVGLYEFIYTAHFYSHHYPKINLLDWGAAYKDIVMESAKIKSKYKVIVIDRKLSNIKSYYAFYDDTVKYSFVDDTWKKPKELESEKVLYIRPYYGNKTEPKVIKNIAFPNRNEDIFAQFWDQ